MLVTFTSKAHADITMFGDVAIAMLKIMDHSGTVPGAIQSQDLPAALAKLQHAVDTSQASEQDPDDGDFEPGLSQRALPLLQMLKKSIEADTFIAWDKN